MRTFWRIIIGIGLPFFAIVGLFPWYDRTYPLIGGFPFVYFWIVLWFPVTTLCLYVVWRLDTRMDEKEGKSE
ncbi:DUF3311 domain-containing protein [Sulfobacillus thermosulfidooxidans]|uniref:DUF3311 domain-containing protein n=1 Tax=Sulfobacillus thermosulfidooxidans TaxID=28034 RepID=UPI000A522523|nr:DUF3311 domain-containing protein [Sulfobacillus thermosulfidooxidans]